MPNEPGIRTVNWETKKTTVDAVEALSRFDLLALVRADIEIAGESDTRPPEAATNGPWAAYAGDPLAMSGAGSTSADGDVLTYNWTFGDGSTASGAGVTHTYAMAGTYAVRLIVTDILGLADTAASSATVTLLPPEVGIARAQAGVGQLVADGLLNNGQGNSLTVKLDAALRWLDRGSSVAARGQLGAYLNELDALVQSGQLTESQVAVMREVIGRVLRNLFI